MKSPFTFFYIFFVKITNIVLPSKNGFFSTVDISDKLNAIKKGDAELSAKIDAAADKFVTNDFKSAFAALKKYVNLQNQMIYKIADIYEKEKSVSYEIFTGMLHTTHQDMSNQEIDYINFLSGVDYYADKEK